MPKNYTDEQLLQAIDKSGGVMDYICSRLGTTYKTAVKYIEQSEAAQEALEIERCKFNAQAYSKFNEAIKAGERWAVERSR